MVLDLRPLFLVFENRKAAITSSGTVMEPPKPRRIADRRLHLHSRTTFQATAFWTVTCRCCSGIARQHVFAETNWDGNDTTFNVKKFSHLLTVNSALTDIGDVDSYATDKSQHTRDLVGRICEKLEENAMKLAKANADTGSRIRNARRREDPAASQAIGLVKMKCDPESLKCKSNFLRPK